MSDNIKIIADKVEIDDIAEAVREKTGKTEKMSLGDIARNVRGMSEAVTEDLDEEITAQEEKISTQDGIISELLSAIENKTADEGSNIETCTVSLNHSGCLEFECSKINNSSVTIHAENLYELEGEIIIPNVICNTLAFVTPYDVNDINITVNGTSITATKPTAITVTPQADGYCYIRATWSGSLL